MDLDQGTLKPADDTPGAALPVAAENIPTDALATESGKPSSVSGTDPQESSPAEQSPTNETTKKHRKDKTVKVRPAEVKPTFHYQLISTAKLCILHEDREDTEEKGTADFAGLRTNIDKLGITQPLVVRFDENLEQFPVIDGKRRLRAALSLGLPEVPCHVIQTNVTELQERGIALSGNTFRKEMTPYEWAKLFKAMLTETDADQVEVAEQWGFSRSVVTEYLKLLKPNVKKILTKKELELLKTGHFSAKRVIREVTRLEKEQREKGSTEQNGTTKGPPGKTGTRRIAKKPANHYAEHTYSDPNTGFFFEVMGKKKKAPPKDDLIVAIKKWLASLETEADQKLQV